MADTGAKLATDLTAPGWTNPGQVLQGPDESYAYEQLNYSGISSEMRIYDFGFAVPVGSTINGIYVVIRHASDIPNVVHDYSLKLYYGGVQGNDRAKGDLWSGASEASYGSSSDLWGYTGITASIVNNSGFGLSFYAKNDSLAARPLAELDYIKMTVYYTAGAGGWAGKVLNISSPAKIMGTALASVVKVIGK